MKDAMKETLWCESSQGAHQDEPRASLQPLE
jgi:hypothetical protein